MTQTFFGIAGVDSGAARAGTIRVRSGIAALGRAGVICPRARFSIGRPSSLFGKIRERVATGDAAVSRSPFACLSRP
jgi:hypothetical protein